MLRCCQLCLLRPFHAAFAPIHPLYIYLSSPIPCYGIAGSLGQVPVSFVSIVKSINNNNEEEEERVKDTALPTGEALPWQTGEKQAACQKSLVCRLKRIPDLKEALRGCLPYQE